MKKKIPGWKPEHELERLKIFEPERTKRLRYGVTAIVLIISTLSGKSLEKVMSILIGWLTEK